MPSGFEVVRSEDCDHDLELIFDHLFAAYSELGDPVRDAFERAEQRLLEIEGEIDRMRCLRPIGIWLAGGIISARG